MCIKVCDNAIIYFHSGLHSDVSYCSSSLEGTEITSISHFYFLSLSCSQLTQKDLLALDFEGILNYFRVSLPRKISSEDECKLLFDTAYSFKVRETTKTLLNNYYKYTLGEPAQTEKIRKRLPNLLRAAITDGGSCC